MRVLSIVCLALALPQFAGAQDTVAPDGDPPPAPPAVETPPPENAPAPPQAAPPPAPEQPPQAAPPAPPAYPPAAPQPYQPPAPPPYQPPAPQPYQPPAYAPPPPGYGYPPPRPVAPAPPPWGYTPQPSPLLTQPWHPPAQPAPQTHYYYYAPPQYVAPPVTLPPLPQGYSYVPAPLPPLPNTQLTPPGQAQNRDQLYARLHQIDTRLDALRAERVSTGGPIFAMVFGFGSMAIAGVVGIAAADNAREIKDGNYASRGYYDSSLDFNDDGDVDRGDRKNWVKTARVGAGIAGAGFVIGLLGIAGLRNALEERRTNAEEQNKLRAQKIALRRQLDYAPTLGQNQYGLSVRGRF